MAEDKMNARIIHALEITPQVEIPADFAARVTALVPTQAKERLEWVTLGSVGTILTPGRYGRWAVVACLLILPVLMLVFAHQVNGVSLYWFSIEAIFIAQSVLLALWLAARGDTFISSLRAD
jgi:hypothetical protein